MELDEGRARRVMQRLGRRLGLDAVRAAEGVVRVVNAGMERAIRRISVERGHDPRRYTFVAFGGAAGMHICELADALGVLRVIVPLHPGLLSAWGAMRADLQRDAVRTVMLSDPSISELSRILRPLERQLREEMRAEDQVRCKLEITGLLDVRYRGQSYELCVPAGRGYRDRFHAAHQRLYGYCDAQRCVEVINVRATARLRGRRPPVPSPPVGNARPRRHRFRWKGRWLPVRWYERESIPRGRRVRGPLIITELSSTTVVPPGWTARGAPAGELILEAGRRAAGSRRRVRNGF